MSQHHLVEKISNTIYRPCVGLVLKHNVKLASKDKEGKRNLYYNEYEYSSSTYTDTNKLLSIKLNYSSYLTLEEEGKDWNDKEGIMIGYNDLYYIKKNFKQAAKWFDLDDLYLQDADRLIINAKYKNLRVKITNLPGNKLMTIVPGIMLLDKEEEYECASMFINDKDKRFDIMMDRFLALTDILINFDLYIAGQAVVNYLGRPELGRFKYQFNNNQSTQEITRDNVFGKGTINRRQKNGFDSLGDD
jgi:hypothetical protein